MKINFALNKSKLSTLLSTVQLMNSEPMHLHCKSVVTNHLIELVRSFFAILFQLSIFKGVVTFGLIIDSGLL